MGWLGLWGWGGGGSANEHSLLVGCDVTPDGGWLAGWLTALRVGPSHGRVALSGHPSVLHWGAVPAHTGTADLHVPWHIHKSVSLECRLKSSLVQPLTELGAGLAAPVNVNEGGQLFPSPEKKAWLL